MVSIEKRGYKTPISLEALIAAHNDPSAPQWKGRHETPPLTDEDRAAHARAVAALEELESNPWAQPDGWDGGYEILDLKPQERFTPEETHKEYMERVREWWEGRK